MKTRVIYSNSSSSEYLIEIRITLLTSSNYSERRLDRRLFSAHSSGIPPPKLDWRRLASDPHAVSRNIRDRNSTSLVQLDAPQRVADLYSQFHHKSGVLNSLRHERAKVTRLLADQLLPSQQKDAAILKSTALKREVLLVEDRLAAIDQEMNRLALLFPNFSHPDCPVGSSDKAKLLFQHDASRGILPVDARRDHVDIGIQLDLFDFQAGAQVTGSSWTYMLGEAALLEQALISYAISTVIKHGFSYVSTPDVVRADVASRCGFNPRGEDDVQQNYTLGPTHSELSLAATSEIPLAGLYANTIIDLRTGPRKLAAVGQAFRMEAGARGKDTKGLYRLHQFTKVEMFVLCDAFSAETVMLDMLKIQREILEGLDIPFRSVGLFSLQNPILISSFEIVFLICRRKN